MTSRRRNFFSICGVPTVTKPGITVTTMSVATAGVKTKPPLVRSSSVAHTIDDTAMHLTWEADLSLSRCHLACCALPGNVTGSALAISSLCESCVPSVGFLGVHQQVMSQVCRELKEASVTVLGYITEAEDVWTTGPSPC